VVIRRKVAVVTRRKVAVGIPRADHFLIC